MKKDILRDSLVEKCKELKSYLENQSPLRAALKTFAVQIEEKWTLLAKQYDDIETTINKGKVTCTTENYSEFIKEREKMREGYSSAKVYVEDALEELLEKRMENSQQNMTLQQSDLTPTMNIPLPVWDIKPFSGNIIEFQSFWQQFEACIDNNPGLPDIRKFSYLLNSLRGNAKRMIEGFPLTTEAYKSAKEYLLERFGQQNEIRQAHLNKLQELNFSKPAHDAKGLSILFNEVKVHVRVLESIGVKTESYGFMLSSILMHKIPKYLLREWTKEADRDCNDLNALLKFIGDNIKAEERCQLMTKSEPKQFRNEFHREREQQNSTYRGTASALIANNGSLENQKKFRVCSAKVTNIEVSSVRLTLHSASNL